MVAAAAMVALTEAPRGHAQDAQPATSDAGVSPGRPNLTPPVLQYDGGVSYPKQAIDDEIVRVVVVTLVVGIGADGAVTSAEVEEPVGHGFDEAAAAAAKGLKFDPAKRDGVPVASRIRFQYTFAPPPAAISGVVRTLASDRPIAGATVTARDVLGNERATTTGVDGSWRIDRLPPGAYHVTIAAADMQTRDVDETLGPGREERAIDRLDRSASPKAAPVPDAGVAASDQAEEVDVRGTRPPREVTVFALDQREINRIPGTSGDALHSLENLPGVARPPALSGLLIVRGSAPQDSQYFVDGTPIPIVYHFGGLFSVLPTEAIDRIDFYPGNFSTQYGRAMGGIVDVGLAEPKGDRVHALAEVNLIDARVLAQGPVFDTGWKFLVAGRRSYVDAWLGPVLNSLGSNVSVAPVYYDYQAIVERNLGSRSSLRFAFFGSDDRLALLLSSGTQGTPTLAGQLSDHTGFWRAQGLYKLRLNDSTQVRVVVAAGQDFVSFTAGNIYFNLTDWPITGRAEVSQKLDPRLTMNVGLDIGYGPYTVSARLPPLPTPGTPPSGPFSSQPLLQTKSSAAIYEPAAYVEWEATPWHGARIVPGIRLDYTKDTHAWDLDPRIVVRQDVTTAPRTTLKAGVGLFSQPPQPQETNAVFGTPGLTSNRAYHYDLGIEHEFTRHVDGSIEGFYKQLDHLVSQNLGNTGSGVIYGAEVLLRYKPDAHFFGWLAYTLSRSVRRDQPGAPLVLSEYDETHVLTVLGSYRLGHGWEFGARFRLTSGYMFTPAQYGYYDENVGSYSALQAYPQFGSRLPLFHSLDLRVDKTWKFHWGSFAMYLDVLNVYNNANVDGISYNYNSTLSSHVGDLPILPSLGLRLEM